MECFLRAVHTDFQDCRRQLFCWKISIPKAITRCCLDEWMCMDGYYWLKYTRCYLFRRVCFLKFGTDKHLLPDVNLHSCDCPHEYGHEHLRLAHCIISWLWAKPLNCTCIEPVWWYVKTSCRSVKIHSWCWNMFSFVRDWIHIFVCRRRLDWNSGQ